VSYVTTSVTDEVMLLGIDRPPANAMNVELLGELVERPEEVEVGAYGLTEVKVGVPYPQAAIGVVRAELSPHAARRLVLGNRLTDAEECLRLGVFDEVVPDDAVVVRALEVAKEMAALRPDVYARTKHDLRGAALAAMREAADADPLLDAWVQKA
jgi:enoyl-CoA hydratase